MELFVTGYLGSFPALFEFTEYKGQKKLGCRIMLHKEDDRETAKELQAAIKEVAAEVDIDDVKDAEQCLGTPLLTKTHDEYFEIRANRSENICNSRGPVAVLDRDPSKPCIESASHPWAPQIGDRVCAQIDIFAMPDLKRICASLVAIQKLGDGVDASEFGGGGVNRAKFGKVEGPKEEPGFGNVDLPTGDDDLD